MTDVTHVSKHLQPVLLGPPRSQGAVPQAPRRESPGAHQAVPRSREVSIGARTQLVNHFRGGSRTLRSSRARVSGGELRKSVPTHAPAGGALCNLEAAPVGEERLAEKARPKPRPCEETQSARALVSSPLTPTSLGSFVGSCHQAQLRRILPNEVRNPARSVAHRT
jgi:hypothetical protein